MWQEKQIIILPTAYPPYKMPYDKYIPKSDLVLGLVDSLKYSKGLGWTKDRGTIGNYSKEMYQHLYILSDEEIPYNPNGGTNGIFLCLHELDHPEDVIVRNVGNCTGCRTILATTDTSLGLPQIPQDFIQYYIEQYNKGNKIEEVMIEYEENLIPTLYEGREWNDNKASNPNGERSFYMKSEYTLKIPNNIISIKPIKESWSREEVVTKCLKIQHDFTEYKKSCHYGPNMREIADWTAKWIKQNL